MPISKWGLLVGSFIAGSYVYICLLSPDSVLCAVPFYILSVCVTAFVCFGVKHRCWTGVFSFILLYLSLGGVCVDRRAVYSLIAGSIGVVIVAYFMKAHKGREYVQVQVCYNNKAYRFSALIDTGNFLTDPVSGRPVLIVSADVAQQMTGLSVKQLRSPLETMDSFPGLRLIPYNTVGQSGVFLLGLFVSYLKIGTWQGSGIIALSPEVFDSKGSFQALAGGYN